MATGTGRSQSGAKLGVYLRAVQQPLALANESRHPRCELWSGLWSIAVHGPPDRHRACERDSDGPGHHLSVTEVQSSTPTKHTFQRSFQGSGRMNDSNRSMHGTLPLNPLTA
eukprot:431019-Prymnesium_polylepis.1